MRYRVKFIAGYFVLLFFCLLPISAFSAPDSVYIQPKLDGTTMSFLYDRMEGTVPDFQKYAQNSGAYRVSTTFNRDAVLQQKIQALQTRFDQISKNSIFSVRIGVQLLQYQVDNQAYMVDFGESSYIPVEDNIIFHQYGIQFRNRAAIAQVPMTVPQAEAFAKRFNLSTTQGSDAGYVVLELAYHLDSVPPSLEENGPSMVNAVIVAGRLLTQSGQEMYNFPIDAVPMPSIPSTLKAADIQGIGLTTSTDAALSAGKAGWTKQLGSFEDGGIVLLFNGLANTSKTLAQQYPRMVGASATSKPPAEWAICAGREIGREDFDARAQGEEPPAFENCMALDGKSGHLTRIASEQHLANDIDTAGLRARLDAKYGPPISIENDGDLRIWLGHDPADPSGPEVEITAEINGISPNRNLVVSATQYNEPTKQNTASATTAEPKL
ncbi:hypothetical protein [Komagataeibacter sp. FNDCR2]|uniref:hypothetical protein n=1 Tax=Komagataeibacter sp. FNDCR2 TaxID=2878682 RepID=UPI001E49933F|nr:hypothetical protein [Komagataeibacter sp. FNDCR2]MCE2575252.1 hypothetical protein [Komagataeibacter sp. FNDCR2]